MRNATRPRSWKRVRQDVLSRDSICKMCRFRLSTEVEQIRPGGGHEPSNLRGVCWRCYRRTRREQRTEQTVTEQIGTVRSGAQHGGGALVVTRGPTAGGKRFDLHSATAVAGRQPGVEVFLNDGTVSRRHVEFTRDAESGRMELRDLGSLNGTYVNNERIEQTELSDGDKVRIGAFHLIFVEGGQ